LDQIDSIAINFNESGIFLINITLALIMFGIALDLSIDRFKKVLALPRSLIIGLISQLIVLPLGTFLLIVLLEPIPSIALGMILVASCPGGNISNFISAQAKANVELSIVMTVISSLLAMIFTPINFAFYGNLYKPTQSILQTINLDWMDIVQTIGMIIIVPIIIGLLVRNYYPIIIPKIASKIRNSSMLLFLLIVLGAFVANWKFFIDWIGVIFFLVLLHNALALSVGYILGILGRLPEKNKRSLSIETGIQNSGLGLLLIFTFFDGLGGMAIVTAWWGIWHIIAGFTIAYFWNKTDAQ